MANRIEAVVRTGLAIDTCCRQSTITGSKFHVSINQANKRMPLVVQKFGGTSVADSQKILAAARKAVRTQQRGNQVVVVVSACLLYTSPSPRDATLSRMPSSA